jgi:hypothetical protein
MLDAKRLANRDVLASEVLSDRLSKAMTAAALSGSPGKT